MAADICPYCGEPILDGQPRHTLFKSHYDCAPKQTPADIETAIRGIVNAQVARIDIGIKRLQEAIEQLPE